MDADRRPGRCRSVHGDVLRQHARRRHRAHHRRRLGHGHRPGLTKWIGDNVAFPNSRSIGSHPLFRRRPRPPRTWPLTEEYCHWCWRTTSRPADRRGRTFRRAHPDRESFEAIKGRLLNASHMLLAYPAALTGSRWVSEAANDPAIAQLLNTLMAVDAGNRLSPASASVTCSR
jgi:Mannitol dehydrogenase C-terminal domain